MPDLKTDRTAWPVIAAIKDAAPVVFGERGVPLDHVTVQHGEQVVFDIADNCGSQLWVRLVQVMPSQNFPAIDDGPVLGRAPQRAFAVTIEVGIVHCSDIWSDPNYAPSDEDYLSDSELSLAEMTAVRETICRAMTGTKRQWYFVPGYTPTAGGGVVGGYWQFTMEANPRVND